MTTIILLAAGSSRRFGPLCKLQAPYRGKPLVRHPAEAILETGLRALAVVADPAIEALLPEFPVVRVAPGPQSASLKAGLSHVATGDALIVLGDMPHVTAALIRRVAAAPAPATAWDGDRIMPPVSIPASLFQDVAKLTEDRGAASLLRNRRDLHRITVAPHVLKDVDRPADLE